MGLGILLINETSEIVHQQGYRVMAKFSSTPIYLSMKKQDAWCLTGASSTGLGPRSVAGKPFGGQPSHLGLVLPTPSRA